MTMTLTPGRGWPSASTVLPRMLPVVWAETESVESRKTPLKITIVIRRLVISHPLLCFEIDCMTR